MTAEFDSAQQIKALIEQYFVAVCQADVPRLKSIFHDQAAMYGYLGDLALAGTPEPFYGDLSSKPSMAQEGINCTYVLLNLQVTGSIAAATILVDNFFGAVTVEDQFHLMRVDGRWRIVCKTFTTL